MDLITYLAEAVVLYFVLQFVLGIYDAYRKLKSEASVELMSKINAMVHQVKIEQHGEVEYWYDADTDSFLGQGRTKEEIISTIKARFPTHIFLLKDIGGLAAQTEWKIMPPEPFGKIQFDKELFVND